MTCQILYKILPKWLHNFNSNSSPQRKINTSKETGSIGWRSSDKMVKWDCNRNVWRLLVFDDQWSVKCSVNDPKTWETYMALYIIRGTNLKCGIYIWCLPYTVRISYMQIALRLYSGEFVLCVHASMPILSYICMSYTHSHMNSLIKWLHLFPWFVSSVSLWFRFFSVEFGVSGARFGQESWPVGNHPTFRALGLWATGLRCVNPFDLWSVTAMLHLYEVASLILFNQCLVASCCPSVHIYCLSFALFTNAPER